MQRSSVDWPEPDGPSRHMTSPRATSSETPFSTSRRPKRLCTPSALTIAVAICLDPRFVAEREHARADSLRQCLPAVALSAAVIALEVVLPDVQHARADDVPEARRDQQRDRLEVDPVDQLRGVQQL